MSLGLILRLRILLLPNYMSFPYIRMRPGRFEVQIEVPKPRTAEQRIEILRVHTDSMARNGRVVVKDAPQGTAAWSALQVSSSLSLVHFV